MKDIEDVVDEIGVELNSIGNNVLRGLCPLHNDTQTPNFTVYPDTQSWYCFACSIGGDAVKLIMEYYGYSQEKAHEIVYGKEIYRRLLERLQEPKEIFDYSKLVNQTISNIAYTKFKNADEESIKKIFAVLKEFDVNMLKLHKETEFNSLLKNTLLLL